MADYVAGKRVLVTGAASGFGRILCGKLAARDARVVGTDIDEAGLKDLRGEVGDGLGTSVADVTRAEDLANVAATMRDALPLLNCRTRSPHTASCRFPVKTDAAPSGAQSTPGSRLRRLAGSG